MNEERDLTFEEAMKNTYDLANEHDTTLWLYRTHYDTWFVSFNVWDDWLYESDPDGDSRLSEKGLEMQRAAQEERER